MSISRSKLGAVVSGRRFTRWLPRRNARAKIMSGLAGFPVGSWARSATVIIPSRWYWADLSPAKRRLRSSRSTNSASQRGQNRQVPHSLTRCAWAGMGCFRASCRPCSSSSVSRMTAISGSWPGGVGRARPGRGDVAISAGSPPDSTEVRAACARRTGYATLSLISRSVWSSSPTVNTCDPNTAKPMCS